MSSSKSKQSVTLVPDGGWGWMIVLVCFTFHLLNGLMYSIQSIIYLALQEQFGEGKGVTSWILSTYSAMLVFSGPMSASLGVKYGYKMVTFFGSLLLGIGYCLSFFATSVFHLILFCGVISGIGAGLAYVPVIAMCAFYFNKRRSLAVGLGTSGLGVGAFAFPPLVTLVEEEYNWRGVFILLGGLLLNMCALSLLLRPLKMLDDSYAISDHTNENVHLTKGENDDDYIADDDNDDDDDGDEEEEEEDEDNGDIVTLSDVPELTVVAVEELGNYVNESHVGEVNCENGKLGNPSLSHVITNEMLASPVSEIYNSTTKSLIAKSDVTINVAAEIMKRKKYLLPIEAERSRSQSFNYRSSASLQFDETKSGSDQRRYRSAHEISKSHHKSHSDINKPSKNSNIELSCPMQEKSLTNLSIMLMGSVYNIVGINSKLNSMLSVNSKTTANKETESLFNDLEDGFETSHEKAEFSTDHTSPNPFHRCCDVLKVYIDLIKDWKVLFMILVNIFVNFTYLVPVQFIVDRAVESGIDKEYAVVALSLYGAGNICGRILTGVVADFRCMNRMVMYFFCIFTCGFITAVSVFFGSCLMLHNAYGFCFGVFIGGYVILTPLVLVDILGVEMVGQSYGLCLLFQGFSMLIGTPIAGWFCDITKSYTITFVVFGSLMVFSSLLLAPLIRLSLKGSNNEKSSQDEKAPLDSSP